MDDTTWTLVKAALMALIRHGVGWTGVWLVTHGAMTQGDETQYVQIASGIAIAGISWGWSVVNKKGLLGIIGDMRTMQRHLLSVQMLPVAVSQSSQINAAISAARQAAGLQSPPTPTSAVSSGGPGGGGTSAPQ